MAEIQNLGQDVQLTGKSGTVYYGRILDKGASTVSHAPAIACLTNSHFSNGVWHHDVNAIFDTPDQAEAVSQFHQRNDITHLILILRNRNDLGKVDKVQDLIQKYIHR